jgi:cytochrome c oxidase subunit 3
MLVVLFIFKYKYNSILFGVVLAFSILLLFTWIRDIRRESRLQGHHSLLVQGSLKWGLIWFLFREVWFFFRIFWRFFHMRLAPVSGGALMWPYLGVTIIPPFQVPLLNTVILLMSGVTATLAHHDTLRGRLSYWLPFSVLLGLYFLLLQGIEYFAANYSISSGTYGSLFFFGTGFHGLHVCLGAVILGIRTMRLFSVLVRSQHHFGLEFRLWYWHFVDVVWLFLFFWVYTWGR